MAKQLSTAEPRVALPGFRMPSQYGGYTNNAWVVFPFPIIDGATEDEAWATGREVINLASVDEQTTTLWPDRRLGDDASWGKMTTTSSSLQRVAILLLKRAYPEKKEEEIWREYGQILEELKDAAVRYGRAYPDSFVQEFGEDPNSCDTVALENLLQVWMRFEDDTGVRVMER